MHHTRSSSFEGNVGVVYPKSAQMTSLRRDDRGRAEALLAGSKQLEQGTPTPSSSAGRLPAAVGDDNNACSSKPRAVWHPASLMVALACFFASFVL